MGVFLTFASSCKKEDDNGNTFTDARDGNVYKTVKIGDQVWMAENLKYLPSVIGPKTESNTTPYYYVYGYNGTSVTDAKATSYYKPYGVLYNWPAVMAGSAPSSSLVQGVCPTGWHVPSEAEWATLITYLGGGEVAGGKLKETGTTHWNSPNLGATDEVGFTALPGGFRDPGGNFGTLESIGMWWSATELGNIYASQFGLNSTIIHVYGGGGEKRLGYSVRCRKDLKN